MKMSLNNIKRLVVIAIVSACAFVSCVQMEEHGAAVGYLAAPSLEVDVVVDDLMQTKALDFEIEAPDISKIHYVVKDKDGNTKYDAVGLWSEPLVLPVGAYTIEATHGVNGFDAPYFKGSFSGTIIALDRQTPTLSVSLENSLVNVTLDTEFAKHFIGEKVTMASGTIEKEFDEWFYVPSDSDLTLTLVGKNSAENEKPDAEATTKFDYKLTSPARKTAYSIVCKASSTNWPSIEWTSTPLEDGAFEGGLYFKPVVVSNMSTDNASAVKYQIKGGDYLDWTDVTVTDVDPYKYISGLSNGTEYSLRACVGNIRTKSEQTFVPVTYASCLATDVTAAHNNAENPSAMLESTAVKAAVSSSIPAIVAELATSQTASVTFGNGRVKETTLNVNAAKQTLANADGWPYLPQGSYPYTAVVTLTLPGGPVKATLNGSVNVPEPEFSLALSAYTSYDKYAGENGITKDLNGTTGANNCDPATLYNAGGQWSISTAIMANANYAKKLVVNIDGNTDRTFNVTGDYGDNKYYENISSLSWQAHTLAVSVTFDGKTVTESQTHHITGLPYSANPPKNSEWSSSGSVNFRDNDVRFGNGGGSGSITFDKFHIPNNINVSIGAKIDAYGAPINTTSYIEAGGSRIFECTSNSSAFDYKTVTLEDTRSGTLTTSNNNIKAGTTYGLGTTRGHIYYINVSYR